MDKLTEKQKRFCDYYIETGNASESARRAGYSAKTAGSIGDENLKKPQIRARIDKRLEEMASARIADVQEVLEYFTKVMRMEVSEEVVVVEGICDGCSEAKVIEKKNSVRDANDAAKMLGQKYGIFKTDVDITGKLQLVFDDDYGE